MIILSEYKKCNDFFSIHMYLQIYVLFKRLNIKYIQYITH